MKIIIDGDGCAGRDIIEEVGKKHSVKILIYCTINHMINSDYSEVRMVDGGFQSVDMYVANNTEENDIVISQKNRRAGGKSKGNHKRNKEDDDRLYYNLEVLIEKVKAILN